MDMVPVDPSILRMHEWRGSYRRVHIALEEFINSDLPAVELIWETGYYASALSCYNSYRKAVKKLNVNISVIKSGEHVYLTRNISAT